MDLPADPTVKRWLNVLAAIVVVCLTFWLGRRSVSHEPETRYVGTPVSVAATDQANGSTQLWAHNLLLRKGAHFRVYIHWLRGRMLRTNKDRVPSFDVPESFVLGIDKGVADVKLADLADFLNSDSQGKPPLKNLSVENHDGELQIKGMARKGLWLPVRLDGELSPTNDGRVRFHLKKLNVLKIPLKGLFGLFHIELSDLVPKDPLAGVQLADNDIYFDTLKLLPPPHIHGTISSVQVSGDHLRVIYGNAKADEERMAQWHNFLRLSGGSLSFGKLTMNDADLTLIDASTDPWFDLDLANYQAQLVYGTTRMTSRAGVEVYMPDLDHLPPTAAKAPQAVSLEWLKNRQTSPPLEVAPPKH